MTCLYLPMMSLKFLKKFGVQKIKKETTKARQKSLPFKSLSFVEYLSFMEYFLYENSALMLKSLYNLNVCSVASIVRLHELNAGYFVWIHLKFKWKWAFCGWLEKCNYLVHLSRWWQISFPATERLSSMLIRGVCIAPLHL